MHFDRIGVFLMLVAAGSTMAATPDEPAGEVPPRVVTTRAAPAKTAAVPAAESNAPTILENLESEVVGDLTAVTASFSRMPKEKSVELEEHGTFLQIKLTGVLVPEPGKFIEVNSPYISQMVPFQISARDAALRLFVKHDGATTKKATTAEILGQKLVITLDHKSMAQLIPANVDANTALPTPHEQALAVAASVVPEKNNPPPSEVLAANANANATATKTTTKTVASSVLTKKAATPVEAAPTSEPAALPGVDYRAYLQRLAIFLAIFLVGIGMLYLARPILRSIRAAPGGRKARLIQTLETTRLGNRHSISLIQIDGERILLAVTPEGIQFLTSIPRARAAGPEAPRMREIPSGLSASPAAKVAARPGVQVTPSMAKGFAEALANASAQNVKLKRTSIARQAASAGPEIPMRQPTVDPLPAPPRAGGRTAAAAAPTTARRVNIAIGDDGVQDRAASSSQKSLEDITRLIRQKLKTT